MRIFQYRLEKKKKKRKTETGSCIFVTNFIKYSKNQYLNEQTLSIFIRIFIKKSTRNAFVYHRGFFFFLNTI